MCTSAMHSQCRCNPNNSASSFSAGLETLTLNPYTKVSASAVPVITMIRVLLENPNSVEWLSSCLYQNFLTTTTSFEIGDAANFFGYQGTPFNALAFLTRATSSKYPNGHNIFELVYSYIFK